MVSSTPAQRRGFVALVAIVLLAAACGNTTAPTTSASQAAQATPSPTATPAATASTSAAASPAVDPTAGLSIAPPYTLAPLPAAQAAAFEAGMKAGLGAMSSFLQVGAKQVNKGSTNDGLVLAMAFPGVPVSSSFLDSVAGGAAGSGGKVTSTTIQGHDVKLIETTAAHVAGYLHGSIIVFAYTQSQAESIAVLTAVIKATD